MAPSDVATDVSQVVGLGGLEPPAACWPRCTTRSPRIVLLALGVLALFHWAHRFRYTLYDGLWLKEHSELIGLLCYGGAVVGSAVAAFLLGPIPR